MNNQAILLLYKNFKYQLNELKNEDIKKNSGYENKIEEINKTYDLYHEKLEFMKKINEYEFDERMYYLYTINIIEHLENIDDKKKLLMILSYGVLLEYFKNINEKPIGEVLMMSACSRNLDLEDYTYYMGIINNDKISKSIIEKTSDSKEQEDIAYKIMDSQDNFDYDFITPDNYNELVNNGLEVIKSYKKVPNENSPILLLYKNFKYQLNELKNEDIKKNSGYENKIEEINKTYDLYHKKLEFMKKINEYEFNEKTYYLYTINIIEHLENIDDKKKLLMILSYGVLLESFKDINGKPIGEVLMMSDSSINLKIEDYINIKLNDEELKSTIDKKEEYITIYSKKRKK